MIQSILNKNFSLFPFLILSICFGPPLFAEETNNDRSSAAKGVLHSKVERHPIKDQTKAKWISPEKTLSIKHVSNETSLVTTGGPKPTPSGHAFHLKWLTF